MSSPRFVRLIAPLAMALLASCTDGTGPERLEVASVEILTARRVLEVGDTLALQARALSAGGILIEGREATWTSSDPGAVVVTARGVATAVGRGEATLRVSVDGKVAIAQMVVSVPSVADVAITPGSVSLPRNGAVVLTATLRDSIGRPVQDRAVEWSSEDATVATVDASGRVTARAVGATVIRARSEGRSAVADVAVYETPVASIVAGPAPILIAVGTARQLVAIVKDADGNILDRPVTWSSDTPEVASVTPAGLVYGTGHGYATIQASSGGKSFHVAATIANGEMDAMAADIIYHRTTQSAPGEIMILSTLGESAPVKVNAGSVSRSPSASPDGGRIAFYVSMKELGTGRQIDDIYAVNRDGTNMRQLTNEDGYDGEPAWSPDGARIAWRRVDPLGKSSIWIMNADGTGKLNLTADMEATHSVGSPAWSPDGSRIAFSALSASGTPRVSGIWSMTAAGANKRQHSINGTGTDDGASWSPDGQQIAFSRSSGDEVDITLVNVATGAIRSITIPGRQWNPAWSPDGGHIAYWQPVGFTGGTGIYTVRADGTNVRLHTTNVAWGGGYAPKWIHR